MGKYVLAYTGGGMATTEAEQAKAMEAWGAWFGQLGAAVVDMGAPFGPSAAAGGGAAASGLTGYSILEADSLEAASALADGCPVIATGGAVEVYETLAM